MSPSPRGRQTSEPGILNGPLDTSAGDPEVTRSRFKARTTSSETRPSRIGENRRRPTRSRCTCRDLHERAHNDKVRHAAGDPHFRTNETQTFKTLQALRLHATREVHSVSGRTRPSAQSLPLGLPSIEESIHVDRRSLQRNGERKKR